MIRRKKLAEKECDSKGENVKRRQYWGANQKTMRAILKANEEAYMNN